VVTGGRGSHAKPADPWADPDDAAADDTRHQSRLSTSPDPGEASSTIVRQAQDTGANPTDQSARPDPGATEQSAHIGSDVADRARSAAVGTDQSACSSADVADRARSAAVGTDQSARSSADVAEPARPAALGADRTTRSAVGRAGGEGSAHQADSGGRRAGVPRRQFGGSRRGQRRTADGPDGPADPAVDGVADPHSVARTILLDKLTGQSRTRAELAGLLAEREIADDVADEVLDRFTEVGLIDDAAFANAWVESRHRGRGLGKRALAQELRRRGVDDQLARDALDELDPEQEEETARALVRRKLKSMRSLDREVAMRRLLGMLARKGYPGGLAMTVVKQELDASHEELPLLDPSGLEPD
jgi:regulatory protein